jgi:hypothetical protein
MGKTCTRDSGWFGRAMQSPATSSRSQKLSRFSYEPGQPFSACTIHTPLTQERGCRMDASMLGAAPLQDGQFTTAGQFKITDKEKVDFDNIT